MPDPGAAGPASSEGTVVTAPERTWPCLLAALLAREDLTANDTRWAISGLAADAYFTTGVYGPDSGLHQLPVRRLSFQLPLTLSPRHQHALRVSHACCDKH